MNKPIITLLAVWACSATIMAVQYRSAIAAATFSSVSIGKSAVDIGTAPDSGEIPALKSEIAKLRADNSRLTRELAAIKTQKGIEIGSRQVAESDAASREKDANKLLSKNVWKGLSLSLKQSHGKKIRQIYGPLANQLGMDPERQELFLAVMSERGDSMGFMMRQMRGEDADSMVLQKMLSADEYTAWQNYEKSMPVREAVQAFENNAGTELTEDQRERLVDIFQRNNYLSTRSVDVSDDASASRSIDRTYQALEPIINEASAVLTPEQQQAMDRYLGEQVASHERIAQANSTASREARQTSENPTQDQGIVIRAPSGFQTQAVEIRTQNGSGFMMQGVDLRTMNRAE